MPELISLHGFATLCRSWILPLINSRSLETLLPSQMLRIQDQNPARETPQSQCYVSRPQEHLVALRCAQIYHHSRPYPNPLPLHSRWIIQTTEMFWRRLSAREAFVSGKIISFSQRFLPAQFFQLSLWAHFENPARLAELDQNVVAHRRGRAAQPSIPHAVTEAQRRRRSHLGCVY